MSGYRKDSTALTWHLNHTHNGHSRSNAPISVQQVKYANARRRIAVTFRRRSQDTILTLFRVNLHIRYLTRIGHNHHHVYHRHFRNKYQHVQLIRDVLNGRVTNHVNSNSNVFTARVKNNHFRLTSRHLHHDYVRNLQDIGPSSRHYHEGNITQHLNNSIFSLLRNGGTQRLIRGINRSVTGTRCHDRHRKGHRHGMSAAFRVPMFDQVVRKAAALRSWTRVREGVRVGAGDEGCTDLQAGRHRPLYSVNFRSSLTGVT